MVVCHATRRGENSRTGTTHYDDAGFGASHARTALVTGFALLRYGQDNGLAAHQLTCSGVRNGGGDVGGARCYSLRQAVAAGPAAADGRDLRVR